MIRAPFEDRLVLLCAGLRSRACTAGRLKCGRAAAGLGAEPLAQRGPREPAAGSRARPVRPALVPRMRRRIAPSVPARAVLRDP